MANLERDAAEARAVLKGMLKQLWGKQPRAAAAPPGIDTWRDRGNEALAAGDIARAAACYREGTEPPPGHPVAWLNLAFTQMELGQHDAARDSLQRAQALFAPNDPALADVWSLVARERQHASDWPAAAAAWRRVLALVPTQHVAWRELGQILALHGDFAEAEACYVRAVGARGDFDVAMRDLVRQLFTLKREADALPWIERVLKLHPADADAHAMHAHALLATRRHAEALAACDRALALGQDPMVLNMRGVVLVALGRAEEALASHQQALAVAPQSLDALGGAARALTRLHRYDEAMDCIDRALAVEPGRREAIINKAAVMMTGQLRVREALDFLERSLPPRDLEDPDVAFLRGSMHLLLGDLPPGWLLHEARWRQSYFGAPNYKPAFGVPEWEGQPLAGKSILVYAEHGLGDSIHFVRFLDRIAQDAAQVWLRAQKPLRPILSLLPGNCALVDDATLPPVDFVCPLMSLPAVLGTSLGDIPCRIPYVAAPPERVHHWRERLGPSTGLRVGLAWSGNPLLPNDHTRSVPLAQMHAAAAAVQGVEFVSLQKELRDGDAAVLANWPGLRHFGAELETYGDTAALVSLLDVVISVDTSIAHLAGALGRPLSVMLPFCPEWRWFLGREDSPWYPSAKLYRQSSPGDWATPLARAMAQLRERAATAPASA